jgi:hypothetical protein
MRAEPTHVEKLVAEKAQLQKIDSELEAFRRNIRLGDWFEIEEPALRRMFFLGRGQVGDGQRKTIPASIVREFYVFTGKKSDEVGERLREINAELESLSTTDTKEA